MQDLIVQDLITQNQLKILVVDDDPQDRLAVSRGLRERHQDGIVQEVATCSEATKAISTDSFDCVFLDHSLPDGSGLGWLANVREAGDTTPVVVLTGHGDERLAMEAIKAGATDYLPKDGLTAQLLGHCLRSTLRFHQAQERIRQAQEELRLRDRVIAAASNGIVISDPHLPDCPIVYCNPAFSTMTGYPLEEVIGRNCRFLQGEGTENRYVQQIRDCLRAERECIVILRNYRKDGTLFWNELSISPVRDAGGNLTHFIGIQTDITARKDAEDALRKSIARQHDLLRDMFSSVTEGRLLLCASEDDLPTPLTRYADPIALSRTGGVRELRQQTLGACVSAGLPDARRFDMETAVGEAAMNAVVHAGTGVGHVHLHERGTVQVRVEDGGKGIAVADLPSATLRRGYSTAGTMGHGYTMIIQTVDRVHLLTGGAGTTVVLEQDKSSSPVGW